MKRILFFAVLFLVSGYSYLSAGDLTGKVTGDNNEPLAGVKVIILEENVYTTTNDTGRFEFPGLPAGEYTLQFEKGLYITIKKQNVIVQNSGDVFIEIKMRIRSKGDLFMNTRTKSFHSKESDAKESPASPPVPYKKYRLDEMDDIKEEIVDYNLDDVRKNSPDIPEESAESGLKAGYADDNQQFNYFVKFLKKFGSEVNHYPLEIDERIKIRVLDKNGKSVPNASVKLHVRSIEVDNALTYADGSCYLYPREIDWPREVLNCTISAADAVKNIKIKRNGPREITVHFAEERNLNEMFPLDLLFILDTTGSMDEEIERLKQTIEIINMNLALLDKRLQIRYGMVLYRDREDDYLTRKIPFTTDLDLFRQELDKVKSGGGGDTPEDLQEALKVSLQDMDWNKKGIRLAFIITDAPAHLDYGQKFTYAAAARLARSMAVKIFSIGTGGLDINGEYILRQISQFTNGKYIFLTYGEKGESEGGTIGSVSHHTGSNFQADKLESIIIRFAKEELANVTNISLDDAQPYIQARKLEAENKEATLEKLFISAVRNLISYSSIKIPEETALSIIPIQVKHESQANNAEYFSERLLLTAGKLLDFKLVERKNLQQITEEFALQLSGIFNAGKIKKAGGLLGADMLLTGEMFFNNGNYELFLRLIRVETAEILSVTKLLIDPKLGL